MRNIYFPFVGHKLQHATVRRAREARVGQLEQHWVANIQSSQLLKGGRRHDYLSAMDDFFACLRGKGHGVTPIKLFETEHPPRKTGKSSWAAR